MVVVVVVVVKNMTAASWLNQPIRKNMRTVKLDHLPRGRGENNQHLQPPPRLMFISFKLVLVPSWESNMSFFWGDEFPNFPFCGILCIRSLEVETSILKLIGCKPLRTEQPFKTLLTSHEILIGQ